MFRGAITALVTPFAPDARVDYSQLRAMIEWQIEEGIDGIVLCGTTGEAPTLSEEEQIRVIQEGVDAAKGRVPILAGTGSYDTLHAVYLTEQAKKAGADGALVIVPYYNRPTPEGCYLHYQEIGKVGLPLIIYHHPGRSGVRLSASALAQISSLDSVVGIKEASGDLDLTTELIRMTDKPVLSGDDTLALAMMASGCVGIISIVSNLIPRQWTELARYMNAGCLREAKMLFDQYYSLVKAMVLETNPQCVKYALSLMDKCLSKLRLPLVEPRKETKSQIDKSMQVLDLICLSPG